MKPGEVSERLMVPHSKSGLAFGERGFESHPLRQKEDKMEKREWRWQRAHTLMLISILGGCCGIDRFYQRQILWGILKLITFGGAFIWYLIDVARYAYIAGRDKET